MNCEQFKKELLNSAEKDYGICPPPLEAQKGLDILINHFLGEDWYVTLPLCQEQVNSEAVYEILKRTGKRKNG